VGYADPAELYGVDLADFTTPVTRSFPDGHLIKQFTIAKAVDECDGLVSISKLKSHALTRTTGAIKNQFGCIPGVLKAEFHAKLPDGKLFSQMLVDLNLMIQPRLFIMDGVIGMEGNGPRNGTPKPMRVILLSTDPVALDTVVCRMINLNPRLVEPIVYGDQFGLGTMENIELIGDDIEKFIDKTFLVNRAPLSTTTESGSLTSRFMKELITPRPVIDESICTKCGRCVQICPAEPKALGWAKQNKMIPPVYHYQDCIRCYCCQELCPNEAIKVKTPLLGHLIRR
jgi:NAD-dependent dihydropyrimidine dehydrogenase PreA subunit